MGSPREPWATEALTPSISKKCVVNVLEDLKVVLKTCKGCLVPPPPLRKTQKDALGNVTLIRNNLNGFWERLVRRVITDKNDLRENTYRKILRISNGPG